MHRNLYCKYFVLFSYVIQYFEEINENKYLTLVPTNEKNIKDLIKSITKNSDDCDEKYMRIKFDSDDELPLNKTIEISTMKIAVRYS